MAITLSRNLIELVLMSSGAVFIVFLITPPIHSLIAAANPSEIWNSIGSFLRPPFIYLVVNGIIISIAAASRLFPAGTPILLEPNREEDGFEYYDAVLGNDSGGVAEAVTFDQTTTFRREENQEGVARVEGNDELVPDDVSGVVVASPLERRETVEVVTSFFESQMEEPSLPPSSGSRRSTSTRIVTQDTVEGGHETFDSIWKKITEGRQVPRHLQKSDTGDDNGRQVALSESSTPSSSLKKSATKRIMREPSLSQDELNQRAEDFIRRFNQEIRLQRQQSNYSIKNMISPAV